jgi:hypothetical protein
MQEILGFAFGALAHALGAFTSEKEQEHEQDKDERTAGRQFFNRLLAACRTFRATNFHFVG